MALSAPQILSSLQASGPEFLGPSFALLAPAISTAIFTWAVVPSNITIAGLTTGNAGSGVSSGFLTVPPNPTAVASVFAGNGMVGPNAVSLARVIGVGIPIAFSTSAQYTGPSIGVSAGTDISKIVAVNVATLIPILLSNMQAYFGGVVGISAPTLANSIAISMNILLSAGFTTPGTGIVIPVTPLAGPSAGTSISTLF